MSIERNLIVFIILLAISVSSCQNKVVEADQLASSEIQISKEQFMKENMELGLPKHVEFSDKVSFTGTIVPQVKGLAKLSLPIEGVVQNIYCSNGQWVALNQHLFDVSGNAFIDLQSSYAEAVVQLKRYKTDYLRVKELYDENIGTEKDFIQIESLYKSEQIKHNALRIKLETIGLDIEKIESGQLYPYFKVTAPISGYLSNINVSKGQFVEQQTSIAQIIDNQLLQLSISVYEKDIHNVKTQQTVEFFINALPEKLNRAKISNVGKAVNPQSKAIECFAEISESSKSIALNNQFVRGYIIVGTDSVYALPETAFIKSSNEYYVLNLIREDEESYYFNKVRIDIGKQQQHLVEISVDTSLNNLLVSGGYNINLE